jgi:glycosyltransferase involved in cell wall biosynthesis
MVKDQFRPFISIIIPHYNDLDNLRTCIEKLRQQTWPKDLFEIIVADNNSTDRIVSELHLMLDVRVVPAPEQGAGPARNAGVAAARADIFAFVDSDCLAEETWLEEGISALQHFDYVGGKVIIEIEDPRRVTPAEAYDVVFGFNFKKYIERDKFSGSGNLFVPRAVFEKVGGFRSGVSEDMDWCWRANALGFRLGYAERAVIKHPARREWHDLTRKWDRVISETLALSREQRGWRLRWWIRTAVTALSPIIHSPRVICSRRLVGVRSKWAGLAGLWAIRIYRARRMITEMKAIAVRCEAKSVRS